MTPTNCQVATVNNNNSSQATIDQVDCFIPPRRGSIGNRNTNNSTSNKRHNRSMYFLQKNMVKKSFINSVTWFIIKAQLRTVVGLSTGHCSVMIPLVRKRPYMLAFAPAET